MKTSLVAESGKSTAASQTVGLRRSSTRQLKRVDCHVVTKLFLRWGACHLAILFERHDEFSAQLMLDELHILGRSNPDIVEDIFECHLIMHGHPEQHPVAFILRDGTFTLALLGFRLKVLLNLGHEVESDGQRHL